MSSGESHLPPGEHHQGLASPRLQSRLASARRVALSVLALLCVLGLAARFTGFAENQTFYVPSTLPFTTPDGVEDVTFTTADGLTLHAWYLQPTGRAPTDPPAPAVLFCHGNAGRLPNHLPFTQFLKHRGIGVFLFDYRSYGRSDQGWLSRENLVLDVEAALAKLKSRPDVDPARLACTASASAAPSP